MRDGIGSDMLGRRGSIQKWREVGELCLTMVAGEGGRCAECCACVCRSNSKKLFSRSPQSSLSLQPLARTHRSHPHTTSNRTLDSTHTNHNKDTYSTRRRGRLAGHARACVRAAPHRHRRHLRAVSPLLAFIAASRRSSSDIAATCARVSGCCDIWIAGVSAARDLGDVLIRRR